MKTAKVGVLTTLLSSVLAALMGCGGGSINGGSGGGGSNPLQPTASITASASTITLGQSVTLTPSGANVVGSCTGTGLLPTTVTLGNPTTVTPTTTGTFPYGMTCSGANGTTPATANGSIIVNPVAITVTSVVPTCTPSSILVGGTATCTAVVNGTGNPSQSVTWSINGVGTMTQAGVVTSTGTSASTLTIVATSTVNTNVFGMTTIAVTVPVPTITGNNVPYLYGDQELGFVPVQLTGSGFLATDTIASNPSGLVQLAQIASSTQVNVTLGYGTPQTQPAFDTLTIATSDGLHSTSTSIPFIGDQNLLALSASGELYFLAEGDGTVWKYKSDGTPDGSVAGGEYDNGIAVDDKTNLVVLAQRSGASVNIIGGGAPSNGTKAMGVAARNGNGAAVQPTINEVSFFDITQQLPTFNSLTIGSQPISLAMGLVGSTTHAYVISRDGSPTLWDITVSGGNPTLVNAQAIPGVTPVATLWATNPYAGGWHVADIDSGPAVGTVATLFTADRSLTLYNASLAIIKTITIPGIPFRLVADKADGVFIIAVVDQANVRTTFVSVNATTGVVTQLTSVTPTGLLAVGLQVSADGKSIYACQQTQCVVLPNK
jgi:hypothetical protein